MQICIISTPPGDAPEYIRASWIGVVLPAAVSGARRVETISVLSHPKSRLGLMFARLLGKVRRSQGFLVESNQAIGILAEQAPEAAEWWRQNTPHFIQPGRYFLFHSEVCEPLAPNA